MKLYELNNGFIQLEKISRSIEEMEENGENPILIDGLKEKLKEEFNIASNLLEEKLDNMMYMLLNKEAEIEVLKKESARLAKKAKARENNIKWIKRTILKEALSNLDDGKHKSVIGSLYIMKTKSLEITDCNLVKKKYKEKVVEFKIKKADMKEDLKEGKKVAGAYLKENQSVVFRK